jgi:hypothetical protein
MNWSHIPYLSNCNSCSAIMFKSMHSSSPEFHHQLNNNIKMRKNICVYAANLWPKNGEISATCCFENYGTISSVTIEFKLQNSHWHSTADRITLRLLRKNCRTHYQVSVIPIKCNDYGTGHSTIYLPIKKKSRNVMIKHIHEQEMPQPTSWPNTYTGKIHLTQIC